VKLILFDEFLTYNQSVGNKFRSQTGWLLYSLWLPCKILEIFTQNSYLTFWTFVFLVSGRIGEAQTNINEGRPLSNQDFNPRSSEEQNGINHNNGTFDVKSESMPLAQQRRNAFCHI
jgi:hypothetical protein